MTIENWKHLTQLPEGVRIANPKEIRCISCCNILTNGEELKLYCPIHKFYTEAIYTCKEHLFFRKEEEE